MDLFDRRQLNWGTILLFLEIWGLNCWRKERKEEISSQLVLNYWQMRNGVQMRTCECKRMKQQFTVDESRFERTWRDGLVKMINLSNPYP